MCCRRKIDLFFEKLQQNLGESYKYLWRSPLPYSRAIFFSARSLLRLQWPSGRGPDNSFRQESQSSRCFIYAAQEQEANAV